MKEEIWVNVFGYEGKYMVSNFGKIKNIRFNRFVLGSNNGPLNRVEQGQSSKNKFSS
jgi:hypothetical protein